MNDERSEFEHRRKAFWQSVNGGGASAAAATAAASSSSGGDDQRVYRRKTKKALTPAERRQQMKGLSKAFISPAGNGWAKVDPVHVEDESSSSSSSSTIMVENDQRPKSSIDDDDADDDGTDDQNLVALMRSRTKQMQQSKVQNDRVVQSDDSIQQTTISSVPDLSSIPPQESSSMTMTTTTATNTRRRRSPSPQHHVEHTVSDFSSEKVQTLYRLVQMADQQGLEAAWEWARDQVIESNGGWPNIWKEAPATTKKQQELSSTASSTITFKQPQHLPRPLRLLPYSTPKAAVAQERQYYFYFREAAHLAPYEFTSSLSDKTNDTTILFVVRRPYGLKSCRPGLFEHVSLVDADQYGRKAHVSTLSTLEVTVVLKPNLPVLLLSNNSQIRYKHSTTKNSNRQEYQSMSQWNPSTNNLLGTFEYMDAHGKPTLYSLDDMAQQAMWVRQQYATTVTSMAMGFQQRPPQTVIEQVPAATTPSMVEVGVDTSDLMMVVESEKPSSMKREFLALNDPMVQQQQQQQQQQQRQQSKRHFQWWFQTRIPSIIRGRKPTSRYGFVVLGVVLLSSIAVVTSWLVVWAQERLIDLPSATSQMVEKVQRELWNPVPSK